MKKILFTLFFSYFGYLVNAQTVIFQPDVSSGLIGANAWTAVAQASNPADTQVVAHNNIGVKFIHNGHVLAINKTGLSTAAGNCLLVDFTLSIDSSQNSNTKAFTIELGDNLGAVGGADISKDFAYFYISSRNNATSAKFNNGTSTLPSTAVNTPVRVRWIVNNSSSSINYTGPDGSSNTINSNDWHLWVGNSLLFSNQVVTTTNAINSVRIQANAGGVQTASFDDFKITTLANNSTLPVHIAAFSAKDNDGNVQLSWNSFVDDNIAHFQVTRSKDGIHFAPIGSIVLPNTTHKYSFVDALPNSGLNYYQLLEVDKNGLTSKSTILSVNTVQSNLLVYPNPASTLLNVKGAKGMVEVYNIVGLRVLRQKARIGTTTINISNLIKGIYFVKTENGYTKFIKL